MRRPFAFSVVLAALVTMQSCAQPTRIILRIQTDVNCNEETPRPSIAVGSNSGDDAPLASVRQKCERLGDQGTLVLVPPESMPKDTPVAIRVAMRLRADLAPSTEDCTKESAALCIVSRTLLRYAPNETIEVPVELNLVCKGKECGQFETCNRAGQCVPAEVTGCRTAQECNVGARDGGQADASSFVEAGGDALEDARDASVEADADAAAEPLSSVCAKCKLTGKACAVVEPAKIECSTSSNVMTCTRSNPSLGPAMDFQCPSVAQNCCLNLSGVEYTNFCSNGECPSGNLCEQNSDCSGALSCGPHPTFTQLRQCR
jgi:hypothetical protein